MPPRKRPATQATAPTAIPSVRPNKRARRPRLRPEEAPTVHESTTTAQANVIASNPSSSSPGTVSVDVDAITATISAVITQAVKTAFSPEKLASLLDNNSPTPVVTQAPTGLVEQAVDDDIHVITNPQWMFIVFWDTGSHIFQSDSNNNSDSTALFRTRT